MMSSTTLSKPFRIADHITDEELDENLIQPFLRSPESLGPQQRATRQALLGLAGLLECLITLNRAFSEAYVIRTIEAVADSWLGWRGSAVHRAWWLLVRPAGKHWKRTEFWRPWDRLRTWALHDGPGQPSFPLIGSVLFTLCSLGPRVLAAFFEDEFSRLRADSWVLYSAMLLYPVWIPYWFPQTESVFKPKSKHIWRSWIASVVTKSWPGLVIAGPTFVLGEVAWDFLTTPGVWQAITLVIWEHWRQLMFHTAELSATYVKFHFSFQAVCLWIKAVLWTCWRRAFQRESVRPDKASSFVYERLESGHIRLLDIKRHAWTWQLECRIRHVDLGTNPAYEAISYTWGDMKTLHRIRVDGRWLSITSNAHTILQDRASFFETRTMWIDCICIDQSNVSEKNVQVPLMKDIYQKAKRTVIHLGDYGGARLAFSLMEDLTWRHQFFDSIVANPEFEAFVGFATKKEIREGLVGLLGNLVPIDPRWSRLAHILRHSYFSRVWIVQEVVFGSACHIRCGGAWLDWKDFSGAVTNVFSGQFQNAGYLDRLRESGPVSTISHLSHLILLKDKETVARLVRAPSIRPTLCGLLSSPLVQGLKCSDPRDRVFGLVSLSRDAHDPDFAPDYSGTPDLGDFFTRLCCKFIRREETDSIFHVAGIGRERSIPGLPSWVPDWTCQSELPIHTLDPPFGAGGQHRAAIEICATKEVSIQGIVVDRLAVVTNRQIRPTANPMREVPSSHLLFHACIAVFDALKLSGDLTNDSNCNESVSPSRSEALWRTLVADSTQISVRESETGFPPEFNSSNPFGIASTKLLHKFKRLPEGEYNTVLPAWRRVVTFPDIRTLLETELAGGLSLDSSAKVDKFWKLIWANRSLTKDVEVITKGGGVSLLVGGCIHRFGMTETGRMVLVPPLAAVGDVICVGVGFGAPLLLREEVVGNGSTYKLVGEAYVDGIMDGELAVKAMEECRRIRIV